jgi:glycosyltransferase involved in cell wall biosynthesis
VLIENAPGSGEEEPTLESAAAIRREFGIEIATPLVLYTGTFEAYQGLDLLLSAMAIVKQQRPDARLLMAGGKPEQIERARREAARAGVDDVTIFAGERPAAQIPAFLLASSVLVSPRSRGTNTPLKIYQYLRAGRPIVATRLLTHTQVLDDATAILTEATAAAFAEGILAALNDRERAARVGRQAGDLARTKYSYEAYLERTRRALAFVAGPTGTTPRTVTAADEPGNVKDLA